MMSQLPFDCVYEIFEYLPLVDRARVERLSKFHRLVCCKLWSAQKSIGFAEIPVSLLCGKKHQITDYAPVCAVEACLKRCPNLTCVYFGSKQNDVGKLLSQYCLKIKHVQADNFESLESLNNYTRLQQLECLHLSKRYNNSASESLRLQLILLKCPKLTFYGNECYNYPNVGYDITKTILSSNWDNLQKKLEILKLTCFVYSD